MKNAKILIKTLLRQIIAKFPKSSKYLSKISKSELQQNNIKHFLDLPINTEEEIFQERQTLEFIINQTITFNAGIHSILIVPIFVFNLWVF